MYLHFASKRTGAVKLKRNHREFLRRKKGRWLSGEDPFSSWRREMTVIGGTFLSKCSFPSRHSREHRGLPVLHRMPSIASPGVTCYRRKQPLYGDFMLSLATGIHKTSRNTKHKANSYVCRIRQREIWQKCYFSLAYICFKFLYTYRKLIVLIYIKLYIYNLKYYFF